jgi:hypothetical protein
LKDKSKRMGLDSEAYDDAMRRARLAAAAHLDALAVVKDAKSLRLDYLRSLVMKQLPEDSAMRTSMLLRLPPEDEARLLLDMRNSVVMGGDGRSYQLQEDQKSGRELVLESRSAEDIAQEILRRHALARVESEHAPAVVNAKESSGTKTADGWAQAFYLFMTGAVFGATALAALAIYLKKLNF